MAHWRSDRPPALDNMDDEEGTDTEVLKFRGPPITPCPAGQKERPVDGWDIQWQIAATELMNGSVTDMDDLMQSYRDEDEQSLTLGSYAQAMGSDERADTEGDPLDIPYDPDGDLPTHRHFLARADNIAVCSDPAPGDVCLLKKGPYREDVEGWHCVQCRVIAEGERADGHKQRMFVTPPEDEADIMRAMSSMRSMIDNSAYQVCDACAAYWRKEAAKVEEVQRAEAAEAAGSKKDCWRSWRWWRATALSTLVLGLNVGVGMGMWYALVYEDGPRLQQREWEELGSIGNYSHNLETRREEQYWFLLTVACPRCALVTYKQPSKIWLCHRGAGYEFWTMLVTAPAVQAAICSSGREAATEAGGIEENGGSYCQSGGCRTFLYLVMTSTFLCDLSYYCVFAGLLWKCKVGPGILYIVGYVARYLIWWLLVVCIKIVWITPVLEGARLGFTMLSLLAMLVLSAVNVFVTWKLISKWVKGQEPGQWSYYGSLFGTVFAVPALLWSTLAFPWKPIGEIGGLAAMVYPLLVWFLRPNGCMHYICPVFNILLLYEFITHAMADLFLLEALRHKTSITSFLLIHIRGGLVERGGSRYGSTTASEVKDNTRGKFYVFKDTLWGLRIHARRRRCTREIVDRAGSEQNFLLNTTIDPLKLVSPNLHGFMAARNSLTIILFSQPYQQLMNIEDHNMYQLLWVLPTSLIANLWGILMVVIPSIKFHCALDDVHLQPFLDDPAYKGLAWFTRTDVPPWWIGFGGALVQGARSVVTGRWWRDACAFPVRTALKLMTGTFHLILAVLWYYFIDTSRAMISIAMLMWM